MSEKMYHHGNLRTAMIERGIELINEEGLDNFSLRKVAAACGVSHSAPYSHFSSKDELVAAIQSHITEQFIAVLETAVGKHGESPEGLARMGRAYVLFFVNNPQYFPFMFFRADMNFDLTNNPGSGFKPFEMYKSLMLKLFNDVGFPKELQMDTLVANWAFVHGLASVAIMPGVGSAEEWEKKLPGLLESMRIALPEERRKFG
jgi:AcrR family transcriptional regulator